MKCSNCGASQPAGLKYCMECDALLPTTAVRDERAILEYVRKKREETGEITERKGITVLMIGRIIGIAHIVGLTACIVISIIITVHSGQEALLLLLF